MWIKFVALGLLAVGALDIGASIAVVKLHATAVKKAGDAGLVSRHVVTVASGHAILVLGVMLAMLDLLRVVDVPVVSYLLLVGLGIILSIAALLIIGSVQRNRTRRAAARRAVDPARHRLRRKGKA